MRISSLFLLPAFLCISGAALCQPGEKTLKKVITLTPSDYSGGNGAAVVWHPVQKKYYTARAGNISYPLDVYNAAGKRISGDTVTTMTDVRGMWYNPSKKLIYINGYDQFGWSTYGLDKAGIPVSINTFADGQHQPGANSVACFDEKKSLVYFLDGASIYAYSASTGNKTSDFPVLNLSSGIRQAYSSTETDTSGWPALYNSTPIYTGISGQELGFLNTQDKQIDLYSIRTGARSAILRLPEELSLASLFNFGYANGTYFIYDKEKRAWEGYR